MCMSVCVCERLNDQLIKFWNVKVKQLQTSNVSDRKRTVSVIEATAVLKIELWTKCLLNLCRKISFPLRVDCKVPSSVFVYIT